MKYWYGCDTKLKRAQVPRVVVNPLDTSTRQENHFEIVEEQGQKAISNSIVICYEQSEYGAHSIVYASGPSCGIKVAQ